MSKIANYRNAFIAILILALTLRLGLALVNRQANDDHMEVIHLIIETHQLPDMSQCRECFQPKLFYAIAAALLDVGAVQNPTAQIIFIQLLNFFAGVATLGVVYQFIKEYPSTNRALTLTVFALVALNPKLIAINAQASNDTFVILFGTLALYSTIYFFKKPGTKPFALIILSLLLAVSTKVVGWIVFIAIFISFLIFLWTTEKRKATIATYTFILLVAVPLLTIANPLSEVVTNTQKFGTPLANHRDPLPLPAFFHQTFEYKQYYFRPGIVSIQDGFFTFKLDDLLEFPLITNELDKFPPHRTSFWTILYADSHSLHFQNWPPSWQTQDREGFLVSRAIFILALVPTFLLAWGFLLELMDFVKALWRRDTAKIRSLGNALYLLAFGGNLAFLLLYALLFRDFSFIKLIYTLTGLLAFIWLLLRGTETALERILIYPKLHFVLYSWMSLLLGLYIWDVLTMIFQLYVLNIHPA